MRKCVFDVLCLPAAVFVASAVIQVTFNTEVDAVPLLVAVQDNYAAVRVDRTALLWALCFHSRGLPVSCCTAGGEHGDGGDCREPRVLQSRPLR